MRELQIVRSCKKLSEVLIAFRMIARLPEQPGSDGDFAGWRRLAANGRPRALRRRSGVFHYWQTQGTHQVQGFPGIVGKLFYSAGGNENRQSVGRETVNVSIDQSMKQSTIVHH